MKAEHEMYGKETRICEYKCRDCGFENSVGVAPWHPVVARARCEHCGYANEVQTRPSFEQEIAPHVAEAREIKAHEMRRPKSVALNAEMKAVREARERATGKRTLVDPRRLGLPGWGPAALIG